MMQIDVKTSRRNEFVDITRRISQIVGEQGADASAVLLFVPHTTAAVTINENADPDVTLDINAYLEKLIPQNAGFSSQRGQQRRPHQIVIGRTFVNRSHQQRQTRFGYVAGDLLRRIRRTAFAKTACFVSEVESF